MYLFSIAHYHDIFLSNAFGVWLLRAALEMQSQQIKDMNWKAKN